MLFHSSIRKELARSFGATLVVLFTIVLTMLLIRTLGAASRGSVNPEEVMLVLGYTVLGRMPTILTLALFISIVSTLSRMYRESEMIVWFACGRSLGGFLSPLMRFAWPVVLVNAILILFAWPWANQKIDDLRDRFENRGDLQRVQPGEFQESSSGRRVFYIDKDTENGEIGRNVFISAVEDDGRETITSASSGQIEVIDDRQFLVLNNGQQLEANRATGSVKISEFDEYAAEIGSGRLQLSGDIQLRARSTYDLVKRPSATSLSELGWRLGIALSAINLVLLGLAITVSNPRAGRSGNLMFTLFAFVGYINLINFGQRWVAAGKIGLPSLLILMHGGVFAVTLVWLYKRHYNLNLLDLMLAWRERATPPMPALEKDAAHAGDKPDIDQAWDELSPVPDTPANAGGGAKEPAP